MTPIVDTRPVLSEREPSPVEAVNIAGRSPILLTCEHAGRLVPESLGDLGVAPQEMDRHIAYDVGAAALSRLLSQRLGAPLLMQRYSRLVIDCNRPFDAPDCFPDVSDGTPIPVNGAMAQGEKQARFSEIHAPFHDAVRQLISARVDAGTTVILVSVHSFTRVMRATGQVRDRSLGLLFNRDARFAEALMAEIRLMAPDVSAAFNVPYVVDDEGDYTVPVHGESNGIPHVLLEVINDEIADEAGQLRWADILAPALQRAAGVFVGKA